MRKGFMDLEWFFSNASSSPSSAFAFQTFLTFDDTKEKEIKFKFKKRFFLDLIALLEKSISVCCPATKHDVQFLKAK